MDKAQTGTAQSCWVLLGSDGRVDAVARWDGRFGRLPQLYVAAGRVDWAFEETGIRAFEQRVEGLLMGSSHRMASYYEVLYHQRVCRVDWNGWSYLLALDEAIGHPQLQPGVVYTLATAALPTTERLTNFDRLVELLLVPSSLTLEGIAFEQPLPGNRTVVIWEESAGRAYVQA